MSGGISVTYTARLDGIRLGVWGDGGGEIEERCQEMHFCMKG